MILVIHFAIIINIQILQDLMDSRLLAIFRRQQLRRLYNLPQQEKDDCIELLFMTSFEPEAVDDLKSNQAKMFQNLLAAVDCVHEQRINGTLC